jgi:hypothetical protein
MWSHRANEKANAMKHCQRHGPESHPYCVECAKDEYAKEHANERLARTACSRFFIAQPGDPVKPHCDQQWTEWEVGDRRGQDRICLTSCKRKAELIRDALEAFHENAKAHAPATNEL